MKSVIVTGAAGFIGSNMVKFLLDNTNYKIYAIDNLKNGETVYNNHLRPLIEQSNERIIFIPIDYALIEENTIDWPENIHAVYHFAAIPRVSYSVEHPIETDDNNIHGTLCFIEFCKRIKVRRFIFSSSSSVYGNAEIFPTPESTLTNPLSPYALQKRVVEEYLRLYGNLFKFDSVCLRYFNVYGENQYAENSYATVISAWIKALLSGESLRLDGDGRQSRDFTHVEDVCRANFYMSEYPGKLNADVLNVANGDSISLLQIKDMLCELHGTDASINYCPPRIGDVQKTQADVTKLKLLNFQTQIDIKDGITRTYQWYKNNVNKY